MQLRRVRVSEKGGKTMLERKHDPTVQSILLLIGAVSALGLAYSLLVLAGYQTTSETGSQWAVYGLWFATSIACIAGILHWKRWGVYGFAVATVGISVYNVVRGTATLGGASMALLVTFALFSALYPYRGEFD